MSKYITKDQEAANERRIVELFGEGMQYNLDVANEEISRQSARLGLTYNIQTDYVERLEEAHAKILELVDHVEPSARNEEPEATHEAAEPKSELKIGDTQLTGLSRAIAAVARGQRISDPPKPPFVPRKLYGWMKAAAANAKQQSKE